MAILGTTEQVALGGACSNYIGTALPANLLKAVCTSIYYNNAGVISPVLGTAGGSGDAQDTLVMASIVKAVEKASD